MIHGRKTELLMTKITYSDKNLSKKTKKLVNIVTS